MKTALKLPSWNDEDETEYKIATTDLVAIDEEVNGAVECDEEVGEGHNHVHTASPVELQIGPHKDAYKVEHIDEALENMANTKDGDNDDKDDGNAKISPWPCRIGANEKCLLFNCFVNEIVESHEGYEGDKTIGEDGDKGRNLKYSAYFNGSWQLY